jgi:uncharacterized protein YkwD
MKKSSIIIPLIIWSSLLPLKAFSQTKENIKNKAKSELVENNDIEINHETIINTSIKDIIEKYWESEWLNIINKHLMIEMNKIRKEQWIPELIWVDEKLKIATQKQAEFLNKEWRIYHMKWENILRKRLQKDWIEFITSWENLALWQETIQEVMEDRLASTWHKINILKSTYKKMWLGIKNKTRVLNRIG